MNPPTTNAGTNAPLAAARAFLRRQPKRNLLLLALLPVLVVAWLPLLTGRGGSATPTLVPPPATPATNGVAAASGAAVAAAPLGEIAAAGAGLPLQPFEQRLHALERPYTRRWSADADPAPFRSTMGNAVASPSAPAADSSWTPTAIVLSPTAPAIAIVQGAPRQVGDRNGERTLVAIEEHRVVYREGDVTVPIALPAPQLGGRP
jgi:hypothetical protein